MKHTIRNLSNCLQNTEFKYFKMAYNKDIDYIYFEDDKHVLILSQKVFRMIELMKSYLTDSFDRLSRNNFLHEYSFFLEYYFCLHFRLINFKLILNQGNIIPSFHNVVCASLSRSYLLVLLQMRVLAYSKVPFQSYEIRWINVKNVDVVI